jgi:hypothetical protein
MACVGLWKEFGPKQFYENILKKLFDPKFPWGYEMKKPPYFVKWMLKSNPSVHPLFGTNHQ